MSGINPNLPIRYGSAYKATNNLTANTPETIITPAANARGLIIWGGMIYGSAGSIIQSVLTAKSSAPTSVVDGDVIGDAISLRIDRPIFIAPGKGLYRICNGNETASYCRLLYDLL